jgi:hypothetical protein
MVRPVRTQKDHGVLEAGIADARHRHQHSPGQGGEGAHRGMILASPRPRKRCLGPRAQKPYLRRYPAAAGGLTPQTKESP